MERQCGRGSHLLWCYTVVGIFLKHVVPVVSGAAKVCRQRLPVELIALSARALKRPAVISHYLGSRRNDAARIVMLRLSA